MDTVPPLADDGNTPEKKPHPLKGRTQPPEHVAKRAESCRAVWTPEKREAAAALRRDKPRSAKTRAKISASLTGKSFKRKHPRSEATKKKDSEARKKWWETASEEKQEHSRAQLEKGIGYWTGKKRALTTNEKIRIKNKGKVPPNKGIPMTEEQRIRDSLAKKKQWAEATEEQREAWLKNWINAAKDKKNTTIEQFIASKLDAQGIVYEREKRIGNYWVDFFIPAENRIIEVNGCYWHACLQCGYGENEHQSRREKDAKRYATLRSKGYVVEVVWEHDIRKEMNGA